MSDPSTTSRQRTFWDSPGATSSPASASGTTPSSSPAGPSTSRSGPEAARAPASPSRAKEKGLQTLVTSGRYGSASSASAALEQSLASRLMERLDTAGSTLFLQTWKRKATPLRRRYWAHTASARPTGGKDCTSEEPVASSQLSAVPTPDAHPDLPNSSINRGASHGGKRPRMSPCGLGPTVELAAITTPSARDWKDTAGMSESGEDPDGSTRSRLDQLPRQAQLAASGPIATGGTAGTGNIGQLDPAYPRWLMGLPPVWCACAVTAMQSRRKPRRPSSKAGAKPQTNGANDE